MLMENLYNIQIHPMKLGDDYVFIITGGKAHIGASATAYQEDETIKVEVTQLPHHREGDLAAELSSLAAKELGVSVTVVMGIHVPQASKETIQYIVSYVRHEMSHTLKELKKE